MIEMVQRLIESDKVEENPPLKWGDELVIDLDKQEAELLLHGDVVAYYSNFGGHLEVDITHSPIGSSYDRDVNLISYYIIDGHTGESIYQLQKLIDMNLILEVIMKDNKLYLQDLDSIPTALYDYIGFVRGNYFIANSYKTGAKPPRDVKETKI